MFACPGIIPDGSKIGYVGTCFFFVMQQSLFG